MINTPSSVKIYSEVDIETSRARQLFLNSGLHPEKDNLSRIYMINNITEELGKLARCSNKLLLINRSKLNLNSEKEKWMKEGYFRIITSMSLLERLAELWEKMPDD